MYTCVCLWVGVAGVGGWVDKCVGVCVGRCRCTLGMYWCRVVVRCGVGFVGGHLGGKGVVDGFTWLYR